MSLKRNIAYSGILTVSLYILQFITFPYVARVLGVENIGIYDYCYSYVNLFLLISSFGISIYGVREIAKVSSEKDKLNKTFTTLFSYNAILTIFAAVLYIIIWISSDILRQYDKMMAAGTLILLSNLFVVEWLFRGMEDFKYVTYRTLCLRVLYCVAVFVLVREKDDFDIYFYLSVILFISNALINWRYKNRYVNFHPVTLRDIYAVIGPSVLIGGYVFLSSYYANILPVFLGSVFDKTQVGLFVTASKLILIFLMFFGAYTLVLIPRMSTYSASGQNEIAKNILGKSYDLLVLFLVPCIFYVGIYADDIIFLIAGSGYEEAGKLMRLCLPVLLFSGINQINISQVLLPKGEDRYILFIYLIALPTGLFINYLLSFYMKAESSVVSWIIIEIIICFISTQKIIKEVHECFFYHLPWKTLVLFIPLLSLEYLRNFESSSLFNLIIGFFVISFWTHMVYFKIKDELYIFLYNSLKIKIKKYV